MGAHAEPSRDCPEPPALKDASVRSWVKPSAEALVLSSEIKIYEKHAFFLCLFPKRMNNRYTGAEFYAFACDWPGSSGRPEGYLNTEDSPEVQRCGVKLFPSRAHARNVFMPLPQGPLCTIPCC
jgi:hypothetical protein